MGDEFLTVSPNAANTGGEREDRSAPFSLKKLFDEHFPYYLSIGMTYEQFWQGDAELVVYYRKAQRIRNKRENQKLWMQGMYIYEAILDVSPILHAFAKPGTHPQPYRDMPYPIDAEEVREQEIERLKQNARAFAQLVDAKNTERKVKNHSNLG